MGIGSWVWRGGMYVSVTVHCWGRVIDSLHIVSFLFVSVNVVMVHPISGFHAVAVRDCV